MGNTYPTAKLHAQLIRTDILIAETRGPCVNSSATIIQGIDPVKKKVNYYLALMSSVRFGSKYYWDTNYEQLKKGSSDLLFEIPGPMAKNTT